MNLTDILELCKTKGVIARRLSWNNSVFMKDDGIVWSKSENWWCWVYLNAPAPKRGWDDDPRQGPAVMMLSLVDVLADDWYTFESVKEPAADISFADSDTFAGGLFDEPDIAGRDELPPPAPEKACGGPWG